ncbi:MAG TPA: hypothetical protein VJ824_11715, partial [Bacillota bacterium]|nr:hypothetical protein [Bacillota bacterium]
ISVETFPKDWEPWIMRIRRLGLVLDLRYDQQKEVTSLGLPSVVSYSDCRKPCRSRLVVRVRESEMDSWIKGWRQLRPYTPRSYWLDSLTITCPILRSREDLIQYLMFITHVCSRVPAKLLGIFPRKGSIHIGADADLLFFRGKNMLDRCSRLVPDKVMVKGQFIQDFLTLKTSRRGEFLVGNQTYAFEY